MSVVGKWRIVEMPGFPTDYPDLVEQACILFEKQGGGEFALGACTGHIWEVSSAEATSIDFSWDGSDEMDEVCGDGEAELQPMAPYKAKSDTDTATNSPSSPENGLLQQPSSLTASQISGL